MENTMKLMIRCKMLFHARQMLIDVLQLIVEYEIYAVELKEAIDQQEDYQIDKDQMNRFSSLAERVNLNGQSII